MVRRPDLPPGAHESVPELDLELRTVKLAAPKPRAVPEPDSSLELAVDPRALVLERAETVSMSTRAGAVSGPLPPPTPPPHPSRSSLAVAASPRAPASSHAVIAGAANIASDAALLADYGEPPRNWLLAPLYAYRVVKRRRALKSALAGRQEEAKRATGEAENALVAFVERVRGTAAGLPAYSGALEELGRAEEAMRSRDHVLATEQDAHGARLVQVDARLSTLEAELAQAQREERTAAQRLADAQEGARARGGKAQTRRDRAPFRTTTRRRRMIEATGDLHAKRARERIGMVLGGKWTIESVLGVGGMAAVYAATHRNGKRVAVKMMHKDLSENEEVKRRFLQEGYAANAIQHDGAVSVLDDDVAPDGSAFIVMELLEGETVEDRWERSGRRLAARETLAIVEQVLAVLAAAHAKNIVHRDIKPENLFVTKAGAVKVLDFGIAKVFEGESERPTSTRVGMVMGTPAFMSPEQARARWDEVDGRTDLWAVGATMFTLLTGRYVHEAPSEQERLIASATKRAPTVADVAPAVPGTVAAIVDRALAYAKEDRWADAAAMHAADRRRARRARRSRAPRRRARPTRHEGAGGQRRGDARLARKRQRRDGIRFRSHRVEQRA